MQTLLKLKISDFLVGDSVEFEVHPTENQLTMVQAYIEFPKDIKLEASIMKGYNILKTNGNHDSLNSEQDNFLK